MIFISVEKFLLHPVDAALPLASAHMSGPWEKSRLRCLMRPRLAVKLTTLVCTYVQLLSYGILMTCKKVNFLSSFTRLRLPLF
jgi:hypothetical protein